MRAKLSEQTFCSNCSGRKRVQPMRVLSDVLVDYPAQAPGFANIVPGACRTLADLLICFCFSLRHLQFVLYSEDESDTPGSDVRQVAVRLVVYHTLQRHISILDDDVN